MTMKPWEHLEQAEIYLEQARSIAAKELGEAAEMGDPEADPIDVAEIVGPFYNIAMAHAKMAEIGLKVELLLRETPTALGSESDQGLWLTAIGYDAL